LTIYQKKKQQQKQNQKKGKGRVFTLILLYKTYYTQKKMNFPMPLHRKHCKEGTTVITQFWPVGF